MLNAGGLSGRAAPLRFFQPAGSLNILPGPELKPSSLIGHVAELHAAVRAGTRPADRVTAEFFARRRYLGSRDRRFIADALYAMLRRQRMLEALARETLRVCGAPAPEGRVPGLALYAVHAVRFGGETPAGAAEALSPLWETFVRTPPCSAFLEAATQAEIPESSDPVKRLALVHSMPEFLLAEWTGRFGPDETEALCVALNQPAPTAVRVNTLRTSREECRTALAAEGLSASPTTFSPVGLTIARRFHAESLTGFRSGHFEIQDEASQIAGYLTGATPGEQVLDYCAGGGGKTLHLAALMQNRGRLVARDVSEDRLGDIRRRLIRAGVTIAEVGAQGGAAGDGIPEAVMDLVLVDAPCSGAGTFRRNPGAKLVLTEQMCAGYERVQRDILRAAADHVRPGGRLVYCTCTLRARENEAVVEEFLASRPDFHVESVSGVLGLNGIPIDDSGPSLLLLPHRHGTDGFFAALLRRMVS